MGAVDVDIGANPSAEEAEEGVEDSSRKVVDIIDSFRLTVRSRASSFILLVAHVCTNAFLCLTSRPLLLRMCDGWCALFAGATYL